MTFHSLVSFAVGRALLIAATASGLLLAGAHAFETFGGYAPCALCLDQREAHWTALGVALAGLVATRLWHARLAAGAALGALALVYAASAALALYHSGVEWGFWPGPATCSASGVAVTDPSAILDALSQNVHGPSCTDAAWRLFGISMAGYNFLVSLALMVVTGVAVYDLSQSERRRAASGEPAANAGAR